MPKSTARWPHSVDSSWARADSVARRYLPQKSSTQSAVAPTRTAPAVVAGVELLDVLRAAPPAASAVTVGY